MPESRLWIKQPAPVLPALMLAAFALATLTSSGSLNRLALDAAARIEGRPAALPLVFIENRGQAHEDVLHYIETPGRSIYFTRDGHVTRLFGRRDDQRWSHTVRIDLVGAVTARVESGERAPGRVSYFKGSREQWKVGIPTRRAIRYVQPWPGIDITYESEGTELKSTYLVAPHADPDLIELRYSGQNLLRLDSLGNLVCVAGAGEIIETAPMAFQEIGGRRVPVEARFELLSVETVGFRLGDYDRNEPLIIDPNFQYGGYIGGTANDAGNGDIAVDGGGNAYVAGTTLSAETLEFPVTGGPDLTHNDNLDAFVAKVSADGTSLLYAGYIGGTGEDRALSIAVDSDGSAYITGSTSSTEDTGFPVMVGPSLVHGADSFFSDAFIAKVNADGTSLAYAGFIGGDSFDRGFGIDVDAAGNAYVVGDTGSSDFPTIGGPDLTRDGASEGFVVKVNAAGSALVYSGFVGGSDGDIVTGVAVDGDGNAYIVGSTQSDEATLPVLVGPDLTHNGGNDALVGKVSATGSAFEYLGYVGGSLDDLGRRIAVDDAGSAYVTGETQSTQASFPVLVGPDLTHAGGGLLGLDAFVAKVSPDGAALIYAGYIGGEEDECCPDIAIDAAGNAYVAGDTQSSEATFPLVQGPDLSLGGDVDGFVAKINAAGNTFVYSGYIGGEGDDDVNGIAVDDAGSAYVTGGTRSSEAMNFPLLLGPDLTYNGDGDAFVVKVTEADLAPDSFAFVDQADVALAAEITSAPISVTGIDEPTAVVVTGGIYSVDGGAFTAAQTTVAEGQTIRVRHTSSASYDTATNTVLTIGGVSDTFTSTTRQRRRGQGGAPDLLFLAVLAGFGALRGIRDRARLRR